MLEEKEQGGFQPCETQKFQRFQGELQIAPPYISSVSHEGTGIALICVLVAVIGFYLVRKRKLSIEKKV